MKEIKYIVFLLTLACNTIAQAQLTDTVVQLQEVQVSELRYRTHPVGANYEEWDSTSLLQRKQQSLADILNESNGIFIKYYGGYSLATASIRGAGSSQNLVLWNGLPIESPTLGQLDLSLIPTTFMNKVTLLKGGNSTSWGSAAIGGTIALENTARFNETVGLNYHSSWGSFGHLNQRLSLTLGNAYIQSKTQVIYTQATNDFKFKRADNQPNEYQKNAAFNQKGLLQSFHFKVRKRNNLNVHLWWQDAKKEIPATTVQNESVAFQEDDALRIMGNWLFSTKKLHLKTSAGFFKEKQHFEDPASLIIGKNNFKKLLGDINLSYRFSRHHKLMVNNTHNYTTAETKAYGKIKKQYTSAIALTYRYSHHKLSFQASLREEVRDKQWIYPSPLIGVEYYAHKYLALKAKLTRDYRYPTFNDLYWNPGGNIDLKPEQGWSEELGMHSKAQVKNHYLNGGITYFNRNMDDWIMWAPSSSYYWEAKNIAKVWSWGLENYAAYRYKTTDIDFSYQLNIDYTSSTFQVDLRLPKVAVGDQILYTPKLRLKNNVKFSYKKTHLQFEHHYTSLSKGVNEELAPFHVCHLKIAQSFIHKKVDGLLFIHINNIFNERYYVVERRPTPGIYFQTGINIIFKHKKTITT